MLGVASFALNGIADFGGHLGLPGAQVQGCDPKRIVEPLWRLIRCSKGGFGVCRDAGRDGGLHASKRIC